MNIGINLGSHAGAGLPEHLHYHIIPRWSGDTNFLPLIAETKVISMSLDHVYNTAAILIFLTSKPSYLILLFHGNCFLFRNSSLKKGYLF